MNELRAAITKAANAYLVTPSASNYMAVTKAMDAYQAAKYPETGVVAKVPQGWGR